MKAILALILIATIALTACVNQANTPRACTEEAKICPDGSAVGRTGPNCEFAPCPTNGTQLANPASKNCIENSGTLEIKTGADGGQYGECTLPDGTVCEEWAYLRGECPANTNNHVCTNEEKAAEACTMEYAPVCGKYLLNTGETAYKTFGNACSACASMKVVSYTLGECEEKTAAEEKKYVHLNNATSTCKVINFMCLNGYKAFVDEKGCGCEPENSAVCGNGICEEGEANSCPACYNSTPPCLAPCTAGTCAEDCTTGGKLKATDCPAGERQQACTREYMPVCGWWDSAKIQCIKYPCASTYDNKCVACADEKVISWTDGECPK